MKTLDNYLSEIKPLIGSEKPGDRIKFEKIYSILENNYKSFEERKRIAGFIHEGIHDIEKDIKELEAKSQLEEA